MNLFDEGYYGVLKNLESLKKDWDGYDGKPIKKKVLKKFSNVIFVLEIIRKFQAVGFSISDISVTPISTGNIQFEAEKKNTYLEIEVTGD